MKYIIDIDGTICTSVSNGKYESASPIEDRIEKINKLYEDGHQIVYLTARGMGRYGDNADLARKMFYELTANQLEQWGCKYHKLMLGKPSGDFYIDDKGINSNEFFGD
jgi:capsule biosynthesis phosphatase